MNADTNPHAPALMRRFGTAALLFFCVKGLLWLAAPFFFLWIA